MLLLTLTLLIHLITASILSRKFQVQKGKDLVIPCTPNWFAGSPPSGLPQVLKMEYVRENPPGKMTATLDQMDVRERRVSRAIRSGSGAFVQMFLHPRKNEQTKRRILDLSITLYIQKFVHSDAGNITCSTNGVKARTCVTTNLAYNCPKEYKMAGLWSGATTPALSPGTVINGRIPSVHKTCRKNSTHVPDIYWLKNKVYLHMKEFDPYAFAVHNLEHLGFNKSQSEKSVSVLKTTPSLKCYHSGVYWCDYACHMEDGPCSALPISEGALAFNILPMLAPLTYYIETTEWGYKVVVGTNGPPSVKADWLFPGECADDVIQEVGDQTAGPECYRQHYQLSYSVKEEQCPSTMEARLVKLSVLTIHGYMMSGNVTVDPAGNSGYKQEQIQDIKTAEHGSSGGWIVLGGIGMLAVVVGAAIAVNRNRDRKRGSIDLVPAASLEAQAASSRTSSIPSTTQIDHSDFSPAQQQM